MQQRRRRTLVIGCCIMLIGCIKAPVEFIDNSPANDPNISFIDNYAVDIATYKTDSFLTSGFRTFTVGRHTDADFGITTAGSYITVALPNSNPIKGKTVLPDSLVLIIKPNGSYYGDTLAPFTLKVHQLTEEIENEDASDIRFYNPRTFAYQPVPVAQRSVTVRPQRGTEIGIRLPDRMAQELLTKFKNDDTDIQTETGFINYFKGLFLTTDTLQSKALYYFSTGATAGIIRLYYHEFNIFSEEKYLDFPLDASRQFNNIQHKHNGTPLAAFGSFKRELKKSSSTANKAYLHNNIGTTIKISFPSLLKVKELYPYVRVMKAALVISPAPGTYNNPYQLPPALSLYTTDNNNNLLGLLLDVTGQNPLTGDLVIDNLFGEQTNYSYDITGYINQLIADGRFSESALMLVPQGGISDRKMERLVINDQKLNKGIQLKLYVLGL
jgi:Domain of unknown function (DUF4270)